MRTLHCCCNTDTLASITCVLNSYTKNRPRRKYISNYVGTYKFVYNTLYIDKNTEDKQD